LTLISSNRRKIKRRKETGYREETRTDVGLKKKENEEKKGVAAIGWFFFWFGLKAADTDARPSLLPRDYVQIDMQIDMQTTCKTTQRRQAKNVEAHKTNTRAQVHTPTHTQAHTKSWMTRNDKLFVLVLTHTHKKKTIQINLYIVATARGGWQWTNTGDWSLEGSII